MKRALGMKYITVSQLTWFIFIWIVSMYRVYTVLYLLSSLRFFLLPASITSWAQWTGEVMIINVPLTREFKAGWSFTLHHFGPAWAWLLHNFDYGLFPSSQVVLPRESSWHQQDFSFSQITCLFFCNCWLHFSTWTDHSRTLLQMDFILSLCFSSAPPAHCNICVKSKEYNVTPLKHT